jgi:2-methylcitrate dehydratase PrpD
MAVVHVEVDPEAEAAFPRQRAAIVAIETVDGRRLTHRAPTRKGDPDNPLSDAELVDKFQELVAPALGGEGTRALLEWLWSVDRSDAVQPPLGAMLAR